MWITFLTRIIGDIHQSYQLIRLIYFHLLWALEDLPIFQSKMAKTTNNSVSMSNPSYLGQGFSINIQCFFNTKTNKQTNPILMQPSIVSGIISILLFAKSAIDRSLRPPIDWGRTFISFVSSHSSRNFVRAPKLTGNESISFSPRSSCSSDSKWQIASLFWYQIWSVIVPNQKWLEKYQNLSKI